MNFSIYFCADGVLRAKFAENKPMLSLKFIQENSPFKNNDFRFMTKWWESHTFFEKDLTVATFFQCLEPWIDFFSLLTSVDMKSYLQEISQSVDGYTPIYRVLKEEGPDHEKIFTLGVFVGDKLMGEGSGPSKQNAQQDAAQAAIKKYKSAKK